MSETMLLIGTIVLVAIITSIVFVLLVQRRYVKTLSTRQEEWKSTQNHVLQTWEIQQEKRAIELEHSLKIDVEHVDIQWKAWEAKDTSLIASTAQQSQVALQYIKLEQEVARLPCIDDVPLKKPD